MGTGKPAFMNNPRESDRSAEAESSDIAGLEDPTGGMADQLPDEDPGHSNDAEADRRRTSEDSV
jgi:hypothetical protein